MKYLLKDDKKTYSNEALYSSKNYGSNLAACYKKKKKKRSLEILVFYSPTINSDDYYKVMERLLPKFKNKINA